MKNSQINTTLISKSGDVKLICDNDSNVDINTISGNVLVTNKNISGSIKTTSGSININTKSLINNLTLNTISGDIDALLEGDFNYNINSLSGYVSVKTNNAESEEKDANRLNGKIGNSNFILNANSTSGNILIK